MASFDPGTAERPGLEFPERFASVGIDPFAPAADLPYGYITDGDGYLIYSAGPEEEYDLAFTPAELSGWADESALIPLTYDPTNGTMSPGDIWHLQVPLANVPLKPVEEYKPALAPDGGG